MKIALVDASSAILLYKAALFEIMARTYRLAMVPAVIREITVADHPGSANFQRVLDGGQIERIDVGVPAEGNTALDTMGAGERETLLAFGECRADFIIIDDAKGARFCRSQNIPFINALLCPALLRDIGRLHREACDRAQAHLEAIGRYSPGVVEVATNDSAVLLKPFHP